MILETIKSEGLAQLSYFIADEDAGLAVVIDPRRDSEIYLDLARKHEVKIKHVFETHVHADFVSGARGLAEQLDIVPCTGPAEDLGYEAHKWNDGDTFELGTLKFTILHTPGHSPEHICLLVQGGKGAEEPWGLFTGDTLFSGSVGRPDLSANDSKEELAQSLFQSLQNKICPLNDGIIVYPGHGSGSACGAGIGDRDVTTIGYEKAHNELMQHNSEEDFVHDVLSSLGDPPVFYPRLKKSNQKADVPVRHRPMPRAMPAKEFFEVSEHGNEDVRIVDLRSIASFAGAHVKNALNIGLGKSFPNWAGWTLRPEHQIYLIANEPGEAEIEMATRHLYRLGLDHVKGFLAGGMKAWFMAGLPFQKLEQISVHELKKSLDGPEKWTPLDVRSPAEAEDDQLPHAEHCWLPELMDQKCDLPKNEPYAVYCGSGYRASLGASQLQMMGFEQVGVVPGSFKAWNQAGYETVNPS